ncbi:PREDICTED: dnaJ homolog subfamily C member 8-like [Camelina sativa]|uniref:DnaJ homolog subfamily C member 8-like n=1 Tax=Camelina sativa TaxID=90675 RepID=A0ABM0US01_CAMSA|nr:PREDICTED: dnaJ homolog subfamily C member 8-like [Camelina sativa]
MECNKDEARRAIDIAEKKISANDYDGAKKFVNKAERLYPQLEGLKQVLMTIDVYISASNKTNGESDWYGVLGVDPLADDEAVKKRYKKLALLLHPDKNRFHGAEGAFKLVLQACDLLSDKVKRSAYDQKRKSKQVNQKTPKPSEPERHQPESSQKQKTPKPREPVSSQKQKDAQEKLNRYFEEQKKKREAERLSKNQEKRDSTTFEAERPYKKPMTSGDANSTFEAERLFKGGNANSTFEAERLFKRGNANSTFEAERLFKKPMKTGNAYSTFEAEWLFKELMATRDPNSTYEAQRLFRSR